MSPPAQQDTGNLNAFGFPIRFNNGIPDPNTQETNTTQDQRFPSLAGLGSSLPPSCDLVEYARGASQPPPYLHVPSASPSPNPSYVPRMPLPNHDHNPFANTHPTGPPPLPVPAYIPGTPIPNPVYRPGTTLYNPSGPNPPQPSQPGPVPEHAYGLRQRYTLASHSEPPTLRIATLPPSSAFSPATHIPHDPFPSAPITSGSFAHGAYPAPPSPTSSSDSDIPDPAPPTALLAAMSLYPTPESLVPDLETMTLDAPPLPITNPIPNLQQQGQHQQPTQPLCASPQCPIQEPHPQGRYLFQGQPFRLRSYCADGIARRVFGESNPPPGVWEGLDRLAQGEGGEGDARAVEGFQGAHFVL
ncbi:MAG: hypothetical protein HETSPECPRED_000539 [Heterodermia speciosa]|uniref:Uncharacterized protein n=1 Tax=Heterodermia speciosa TaxID=116794 RepID=A0A8H3G9U2_9LECA|nr:MAG: hypothetical protein HETSPECPRED_000539 [Heterodermia speciosa]